MVDNTQNTLGSYLAVCHPRNYQFVQTGKAKKITGQKGEYELLYELEPDILDDKLFSKVAIGLDTKKQQSLGFVLAVNNKESEAVKKIPKALEAL